jgi:hypothetical protein
MAKFPSLRLRGRVRVGVPPDPDRRRRELPPTASLEGGIATDPPFPLPGYRSLIP